MQDLKVIMMEHPFLKGMGPRLLNMLDEYSSLQEFESGKFIFRQNQRASTCYLIVEGKVELEWFSANSGPLVLQSIQSGEVLGWSWLLPPYEWRMDARAVEYTRAIVMDGELVRQCMQADDELGYELLQRFLVVLAARLDATRLELLSLYGAHT